MLKVPYFKQDNGYSCGPTSLQMVFAFYGERINEDKLTKLLHTKKDSGASHEPLIKIANEEGFYVYVNNESSLQEITEILGKNIPVIVHFIEPSSDEGHYAVIIDITKDKIILNDPWNGEGFKMNTGDFIKRWYGHSKDGLNKQWIIAISKEKFSLGKQYLPK